jgi:anti-sigma factor RsiW
MNSNHPDEELSSYVSGELNDVERRNVEEHLRGCSICTQKVSELRQLNEVLGEADVLEPTPFFTKRVMARVDEERKIIAFRSRRTIAWLAIAASIVFAVFLLSVRKETTPPPGIAHRRPAVHATSNQSHSTGTQSSAVPVQPNQSAHGNEANEDPELIANLDALENWDVIQNYDNLEYLEAAVVASGEGKTE